MFIISFSWILPLFYYVLEVEAYFINFQISLSHRSGDTFNIQIKHCDFQVEFFFGSWIFYRELLVAKYTQFFLITC